MRGPDAVRDGVLGARRRCPRAAGTGRRGIPPVRTVPPVDIGRLGHDGARGWRAATPSRDQRDPRAVRGRLAVPGGGHGSTTPRSVVARRRVGIREPTAATPAGASAGPQGGPGARAAPDRDVPRVDRERRIGQLHASADQRPGRRRGAHRCRVGDPRPHRGAPVPRDGLDDRTAGAARPVCPGPAPRGRHLAGHRPRPGPGLHHHRQWARRRVVRAAVHRGGAHRGSGAAPRAPGTGQSMARFVGGGLAAIVAGPFAGIVYGSLGGAALFVMCAGLLALGAAIAWWGLRGPAFAPHRGAPRAGAGVA